MKKIGFLLIVLILGTTVSMAQNRGGGDFDPEERAKSQTSELKETLDLNSDQEKKVYDIKLKEFKEIAVMRKEMRGGGGDRDANMEKFAKMVEARDKEMKNILSEDQYKKYEKYLQEQSKKRVERRRQSGGGSR